MSHYRDTNQEQWSLGIQNGDERRLKKKKIRRQLSRVRLQARAIATGFSSIETVRAIVDAVIFTRAIFCTYCKTIAKRSIQLSGQHILSAFCFLGYINGSHVSKSVFERCLAHIKPGIFWLKKKKEKKNEDSF